MRQTWFGEERAHGSSLYIQNRKNALQQRSSFVKHDPQCFQKTKQNCVREQQTQAAATSVFQMTIHGVAAFCGEHTQHSLWS